jgi:hypothetical protein
MNLRSELLTLLAEVGNRYPHWRLGQLIENVAGWTGEDLWDVQDEQLLKAAREHLAQWTNAPVAAALSDAAGSSVPGASVSEVPRA